MKFLPLDEHHAILCIITDDGNVDNCVVEIPLGMRPEELDYLAGKVSRLLEGRELSEISEELLQIVHSNIAEDKLLFTSLVQSIRRLRNKHMEQKVFLGGTKQLLNQPEFRDVFATCWVFWRRSAWCVTC